LTVKISVYSDYVCPFCFLAKQPLYEVLQERDNIDIEWIPFQQRVQPHNTLGPEDQSLHWEQFVYPLAKKMGISIVLPNVSPYPGSHLAAEAYYFAKMNGKANEYNDRLLHAFFQEQQNISQVEVLADIASSVGLDNDACRKALEQRLYREVHEKAMAYAYNELGILTAPTFLIGRTKVSGIQSKETLEQIIEQEQKAKKKKLNLLMNGQSCGTNGCQ